MKQYYPLLKRITLCILFFLPAVLSAQQPVFQNDYTSSTFGVYGYDVKYNARSLVVAGEADDYTDTTENMLLARFDSTGLPLWANAFKISDTALYHYGVSVATRPGGGYIVSGFTNNPNYYLIVCTDSNGVMLWQKMYTVPGYYLQASSGCITRNPDDTYTISSEVSVPFTNRHKAHLFKIDGLGNIIWSKMYNNLNKYSHVFHHCVCSDGGFAITGYMIDQVAVNAWVARTDAAGHLLWTKFYTTPTQWVQGWDVISTADQGLALTGVELVAGTFYRPFILKLDGSGAVQWYMRYSFNTPDASGTSIVQCQDHGYFLTVRNSLTPLLLKTDSLGNPLVARQAGTYHEIQDAFPFPGNRQIVICTNQNTYMELRLDLVNANASSGCNITVPVSALAVNVTSFDSTYEDTAAMLPVVHVLQPVSINFTSNSCAPNAVETMPAAPARVYPNPAAENVFIENAAPGCEVNFYSAEGKLIRRVTLQPGEQSVDISSLEDGVYLLEIISGGERSVKKLVVNGKN